MKKIALLVLLLLLVACKSGYPEDFYFRPDVVFINYCENLLDQRAWFDCIRTEQLRGIINETQ